MGEELFLLNMDLKGCAFLVKAEDLIGLRVKEVRKRELFGLGSHEELARLLWVLNDFSVSEDDFGLLDPELVLINQHVEAILREVLDLELVILLLGIDQGDHSLGFVVDSEVIVGPPGVNGGLAAESVVLILKPDVSEGNRGEALIFCLLGQRLVSEELLLVLLDEGRVEDSCLEGLIQDHTLHEFDISWEANNLIIIEGLI